MSAAQSLWRRAAASLVLVVLTLLCWLLRRPDYQWLLDVSSGLFVLGLAGIWVSYFAEREAGREIRRDVDARFSILVTMRNAHVNDAYYDETPDQMPGAQDVTRFRQAVKHELNTSQGEVGILAIAARGFLHDGDGFACSDLRELLKRYAERGDRGLDGQGQPLVKVMLLHPMCEQAVSRAFREDSRYDSHEDYGKTRLWSDVQQSWETAVSWREGQELPLEARAYMVFPACCLLFINDVVYVEPYHFGKDRTRASGRVPILRVTKGGAYYAQLKGHFDHVWRTSSAWKITEELFQKLDPTDTAFWDSVKYVHPELGNLAYAPRPWAGGAADGISGGAGGDATPAPHAGEDSRDEPGV